MAEDLKVIDWNVTSELLSLHSNKDGEFFSDLVNAFEESGKKSFEVIRHFHQGQQRVLSEEL